MSGPMIFSCSMIDPGSIIHRLRFFAFLANRSMPASKLMFSTAFPSHPFARAWRSLWQLQCVSQR